MKTKIAVLCGGPGSEREVSLKSGAYIAQSLDAKKYDVRLVELPADENEISKIVRKLPGATDFAFVGLHGKFGEDGEIQKLLDDAHVPYTGSSALSSALGMDKIQTMNIAIRNGLNVAPFFAIVKNFPEEFAPQAVHDGFGYPCVVKPNGSGSSVGVKIVERESELAPALDQAFAEDGVVIIQAYVKGREFTCGVLGNDGVKLLPLPPIEIIPAGKFFDFDAKYNSSETQEICPAHIPPKLTKEIQATSAKAHELLKCDGLTRSDFIYGEDGKLYFLEINTTPGMTEASLCPKAAEALGWSFAELLDKIMDLARGRYKK